MDQQHGSTAPMLVIGLGHYGRRLLWVLEDQQQQSGREDACILCPPQANGDFDAAALPQAKGARAALVIADCREANSAVRLDETARALSAGGIKAYALLAAPAGAASGARWAGEFAGSLLFPYANNEEWRQVRAQLPDRVHAWLQPGSGLALPDWPRQFREADRHAAVQSGGCLCVHAA